MVRHFLTGSRFWKRDRSNYLRIAAEVFGNSAFGSVVFDNIKYEMLEFVVIRVDFDAVEFKRDERGYCAGSLVSVDECVILHDADRAI